MDNLDQFYHGIISQDNRLRTQIYPSLVAYLQNPVTKCTAENFDRLVDGLAGWVNSSNFKVSLQGLEILTLLINRVGESFRPFVSNVLEATLNRLGDMHDEVRDAAQDLLLRLMHPASSPSFVFDRIWSTGISHKQFRVREGVCICLQNLLNHYGAKSLQLNKIVPQLVKLLDDSNTQVREAALNALTEVYRHVGEKVRADLMRKGLTQNKLTTVLSKFDEVRLSGDMLPTATRTLSSSSRHSDDVDSMRPPLFKTPAVPKPKSAKPSTKTDESRRRRIRSSSLPPSGAGALSEDMFTNSFDQVPKVNIFSGRDVEDKMQQAYAVLTNPNEDWEKRVHQLKVCRAVVIDGGANYDEFYPYLRQMETAFIQAVKDLRSQVVREACITIAFYTQNLENRLDHFSESLLPSIIALIPNSAKVMSSSGTTVLKFIVQHVHSPRLIPVIVSHTSAKSNVIRRCSLEMVESLLGCWPTHSIERHIALLQDCIKKGIGDADAEARIYARKAFWLFSQHFKNHADALYDSLDGTRQKQLQGELSQSSSSNSINSAGGTKGIPRSISQDRTNSGAFVRNGAKRGSARSMTSQNSGVSGNMGKSTSAQDIPHAVTKPKVRTPTRYGSHQNMTVGSYTSLPRQRKGSAASSVVDGPVNGSAQKKRISQSQPGSRSNSPSSRLFASASTATPRRKRSGIPRSQGTSRETSPARYGFAIKDRTPVRRTSHNLSPRLIDGSSVTEDLLHQKLIGSGGFRRRYDYGSDDDAASETSSLCSETMSSFNSAARATEDMNDILRNLSSNQWNERKEGLLQLQHFITNIRSLTPNELRRVTEVFTRMFHDPHAKVFSIFMGVLVEVIQIHKHDLRDWLPILISRILSKCGSDMLQSVYDKTQNCLTVILDTFDNVSQFNALSRFMGDSAQNPNFKVKLHCLHYLHSLIEQMNPPEFVNNSDSRLALSKIIQWVTEPKSAEIRKASQSVIVRLFNLNPADYSATVKSLPKAFQDSAHKVISNHMAEVADKVDTPKTCLSDSISRYSPKQRASPRHRTPSGSSSTSDTPKRPINQDEFYRDFRKTAADIQNLSLISKLDTDDTTKERESTSQDSGIHTQSSLPDVREDSPDSAFKKQAYHPLNYTSPSQSKPSSTFTNGYNNRMIASALDTDDYQEDPEDIPLEPADPFTKILEELSNHEERHMERKKAMDELIAMTRKGENSQRFDEHFKTLLLLLLETLGDSDSRIRTQALQVLRELIRHERRRFDKYAELTILKVLEAHKDNNKEVARAAEECASMLAKCISPEHTVVILAKLTDTLAFPINVAAIKMQTQVIEIISASSLREVLNRVVPGLIKGYEDDESSCRKASVFALVALYMKTRESLMPYLSSLNGSKMKLLNLYIKRAESQSSTGSLS